MRKIKLVQQFDEIWAAAEKRNAEIGPITGFDVKQCPRFHRIFAKSRPIGEKSNRYVTFGIYDSVSKQYALFDTINLSGNFRYNSNSVPREFNEMRKLIAKD